MVSGALLAACTLKVDGDETGATSAGESGTTDAGDSGSGGTGTGTTDPGTTDPNPTTSATGTGFLTTDEPDTESGDDTQSDTGDDPLPAICTEKDPAANADFEIEFEVSDPDGDFTAPCVVDAVSVEAAMIVTEMTCQTMNGPDKVVLRMAEASEGPPAWAAADEVVLRSSRLSDIGFDEVWRHFDLRLAVDDSLLATGIDRDTVMPEWLAPIVLERSYPCGPAIDDGGLERPYQIDFQLAEESLSLLPAHRGALPIDAAQSFAIDVKRADTNLCCHFEGGHWQHLLVRRVQTP